MIIFDLSNILHVSLFAARNVEGTFDENKLREILLNIIRATNVKFKKKYGRIVIACDSKKSWRKELYPFYKGNRQANRDKGDNDIDWPKIFDLFENIKIELRKYTDWPVIEIEKAEGDDIIYVLCKNFNHQPNIIISEDEDFAQLQRLNNVSQYLPLKKKLLIIDEPYKYLEEHIIEGDKVDAIPNILSVDNSVVDKIRQKSLTKEILKELLTTPIETWDGDRIINWKRNNTLINLNCVPLDIQEAAIEDFKIQSQKNGKNLLTYFIKYKITKLIDYRNDFN